MKRPSEAFLRYLIDYNESGGTDEDLLTYVALLEDAVDRASDYRFQQRSQDDDNPERQAKLVASTQRHLDVALEKVIEFLP